MAVSFRYVRKRRLKKPMLQAKEPVRWWLWLFGAALIFLLIGWLHYLFVVSPLDYANKDFMSLWTGGKAVLRGLDPYNVAVWQPLRAEYGSRWMPDPRAPFPLWTFLFTVPFALFPLQIGAAAWLTFQEALLVLNMMWLVGSIGRYRPSAAEVALLALGAFASITTALVLINGQMTYALLAILTLYLLLARAERPFWAGFILSFIALKPNPFIVFVPLFGLWLLWRRRWHTVAGTVVGGALLLAVSWIVQPGWLPAWLNARSKTAVVEITPTVWGLAAELSPTWWLPLGTVLTVVIVAVVGWYLFTRDDLDEASVLSLAIAASLLTTPYVWTYEHALLFLPWLWAFTQLRRRRLAQMGWVLLAWLLPWLLFMVAALRSRETYAFLVPVLALVVIWWLEGRAPVQERSS